MAKPDQIIDHSDFVADVAQRTGETADTLTGRIGTDARSDDVLRVAARIEHEKSLEEEVFHALGEQYTHARLSLEEWFGESREVTVGMRELRPTAANGESYPIPEWDSIAEALQESLELYTLKYSQGFTRLLLVPEGAELPPMFTAVTEALKDRGRRNLLDESCYADGALSLSQSGTERMAGMRGVGYVDEYSKRPRSKKLRLASEGAALAWRVYLVQDVESEERENLPSDETALIYGGKAPIITARRGGKMVQSVLGRGKMRGEVGLTPEAYLALSMQYVFETGRLLDTKAATPLLGVEPYEEKDGVLYMTREGTGNMLQFTISDSHLQTFAPEKGIVYGVRTAVPIRFPADLGSMAKGVQ